MPVRYRVALFTLLTMIGLLLSACTDRVNDDGLDDAGDGVAAEASADEVETPEAEPTEPAPTPEPTLDDRDDEDSGDRAGRDEDRDPYWMRWWENTDFENRTVDLDEIRSGGVPRDGIPPIDEPEFIDFAAADEWLGDREPVISMVIDDDARAYPLQVLTWHEIVNDEFGDQEVAVTFCPLCNSAVAFDREVEDLGTVRLGVSGLLRKSDLIMWDDQTESLWQQITGEAIAGEMAGAQLTFLPSTIVSYEDFKETHPDGVVLSQNTGHDRPYGNNPYVGYDDIDSSPFMFNEIPDDRLAPMERVLVLEIEDDPMAYPFSRLEDHPVVHDEVGGQPVVVFWSDGTTSALDETSIADSQEVGAAAAFHPVIEQEELTFVFEDGEFRDEQTGSSWNILGRATAGELEGTQLEEYISGQHFWFAWAAFQPETGIWSPE
jgi:hypothetical protein